MASNLSGLNVSVGAGEGAAHINHWENFYGTLNYIQQRDLNTQKSILDAVSKGSLQMDELSKGILPSDIKNFKGHADDFTNASLMLASSDVRKNPAKIAEWTKKKNDAYIDAMSLADQSKKTGAFIYDTIPKGVMKDKGIGWKSPEEMEEIRKKVSNMTSDDIIKNGYNTPAAWMSPAVTHDKKEYESDIFGKLITKPNLIEVKDPSGNVIARDKHEMQYYEHGPAEIANKTSHYIAGNYVIAQEAQKDYENDLKNNPDAVQKVFEDAQKVVDQLPIGDVKPVIPKGYVGYSVAKNILKAQPKDVGVSEHTEDPEYKRKQDEGFKMKMQELNFKDRKNMIIFSHSLKKKDEAPPSVNSALLYDASTHPDKQFEMKDSKGKSVYLTGSQVLDAGVQAMAGDNPKNTTAMVLDRSSILDAKSRTRMVDILFPGLSEGDKSQILSHVADPKKSPQENRNNLIATFVNKINSVYGQNITTDDVNRYAIPVFANKQYITEDDGTNTGKKTTRVIIKPTFINPATTNFAQAHSAFSNQVTAKKKGQLQSENPNFIGALEQFSQDDNE